MRIKNTLSSVLLGTTLAFLVPACAQAPKKDPKVVEFEKALEDYEKVLQEVMEKYHMEEYTIEEYLKETQAFKEGNDSVSQQEAVNPLVQEYASKLEQITDNSRVSSSYDENAFCGADLKKVEHGYNLNVYTHHDSWDVTYELDNNLMLHAVVNYRSNEEPARFEVTPSDGASYQAHQDRANVFLKEILGEKLQLEEYQNPLLEGHTPEDFVFDNFFLPKEVIENKNWEGKCPPGYATFRALTEEETPLLGGKYLLRTIGGFMPHNFYILDDELRVVKVMPPVGFGDGYEFSHPMKNPNDLTKFDYPQRSVNSALEQILYWKAEHQKQD